MSYTVDKDRMTRGVGAIAAIDGTRARHQQQLNMARATRRRDRAMAAVSNGALAGGGAQGMGMYMTGLNAARKKNPAEDSAPLYVPPPPARLPPQPLPAHPVAWVPPAWMPPATVPPPMYVPPPTRPPTVDTAPPLTLPPPVPVRLPPVYPPTTGGSGSAGTTTGPGMITPITMLPPLPEEDPVTATDNTTRNVLLVGGAALAAYLLFFRRGPA